jgi:hypothetical protein
VDSRNGTTTRLRFLSAGFTSRPPTAIPFLHLADAHAVGPDASTLIQEVVVAMKSGSGTVQDIQEAIHVHPALPEVVQRAFSGPFSRGGDHQHEHHH